MIEVFWISVIFMLGISISWKLAGYYEMKRKKHSEKTKEKQNLNT